MFGPTCRSMGVVLDSLCGRVEHFSGTLGGRQARCHATGAMSVSSARRIGGKDLPLSTETSETVYGKVGCVGDHGRC